MRFVKSSKRLLALIVAAAMMFALAGCMAEEYEITFNADGSGSIKCDFYMSESTLDQLDMTSDELFEGTDGTRVQKTFDGESYYGVSSTDPFSSIENLNQLMDDLEATAGTCGTEWTFTTSTVDGQTLLTINIAIDSESDAISALEDKYAAVLSDDSSETFEHSGPIYYYAMDFKFPVSVKSVSGIQDYTINGTSLHMETTTQSTAQSVTVVGILEDGNSSQTTNTSEDSSLPFVATISLPDGKFKDVPADAWYYDSLKAAYQYGFVSGTSTTTFTPNGNLTLAQVIQICANIRAAYERETDKLDALKAAGTQWYEGSLNYCLQKGIMSSADEFGTDYNKKVTRAEMCAFFARVLPAESYLSNSVDSFTDVDAASPYADYINTLHAAGIVNGYGDGTFGPDTNVTRAHTMVFIANLAAMANQKAAQ